MNALIGDIQTQWAANATLSSVAGPWMGMASDASAYPYCVFTVSGSAGEEYFFNRTLIEKPTFRFTIYHTDAAALLTKFRAMEDFFIQKEFGDITGTSTDKFVRCVKGPGSPILGALQRPDASGNTVFYAAGVYTFHTQRTLA